MHREYFYGGAEFYRSGFMYHPSYFVSDISKRFVCNKYIIYLKIMMSRGNEKFESKLVTLLCNCFRTKICQTTCHLSLSMILRNLDDSNFLRSCFAISSDIFIPFTYILRVCSRVLLCFEGFCINWICHFARLWMLKFIVRISCLYQVII